MRTLNRMSDKYYQIVLVLTENERNVAGKYAEQQGLPIGTVFKLALFNNIMQKNDANLCALREMKDEIEADRVKGYAEGMRDTIFSLVSNGDLPLEKGAARLDISVEQLKSYMTSHGFN